MYLWLYLFYFI